MHWIVAIMAQADPGLSIRGGRIDIPKGSSTTKGEVTSSIFIDA